MAEKNKYGEDDFRGARDTYLDEAPRTIWRVFTRIVLPIMLICMLVGAVGWVIKIVLTPTAVAEKIADPDNVIYNIEWFRTQKGQIDAVQRQAVTAQSALSDFEKTNGKPGDYSYAQNQEHSRLVANVTGLKNECETMTADYNAHSKMVTRSLFKGSDLPTEMTCP